MTTPTATNNNQAPRWRLIHTPKVGGYHGHRLFLDLTSGRISICDWSGDDPDQTDDGPLWIATIPMVLCPSPCGGLMVGITVRTASEGLSHVAASIETALAVQYHCGNTVEVAASAREMVKAICALNITNL